MELGFQDPGSEVEDFRAVRVSDFWRVCRFEDLVVVKADLRIGSEISPMNVDRRL